MVSGLMLSALVALCCGCATAANTCPVGTKVTVAQRSEGRAQWCETIDGAATGIPSGRTFEAKLGTVVKPGGMPGNIEGPFSSWHHNGTLASRGDYATLGTRSVPEGVWTFWYADGKPRLVGQYRRGEPQGCFAAWNESGERTTGVMRDDVLHVESCTPPDDDKEVVPQTTRADIHLQGMAGPNHIGASNPVQVASDPAMTVGVTVGARKHLGRLRLGGVASVRIANETGYLGLAFGATAGWQLPRFHPRIDAELSAELALQRISASDVQRRMQAGTASLTFLSPLPALQLSFAIGLSPTMQALVGARIDGIPERDVEREVVYCGLGCSPPMQETWTIGGLSYGAVLGIRFLIK
jgi:hypothetical protein